MNIYMLAAHNLGIEAAPANHSENNEKLKAWLIHEIQKMIDMDFQRFIQVLYRLDIDEQKAKAALASENPSATFADLIIARELEKIESRKRYS